MTDQITKSWIRCEADERAVAAGYRFDEERGRYVVDWMRDYLRLYEGEWAGQPFECYDWQLEATMRLFSWCRYEERWDREVRRFKKASIWVPKKNKKSPTLAAWALHMLTGDGEQGQKIFLGAVDGTQIRENVSLHIFEMVRQSPVLMSECTLNKNKMSVFHNPTRSLLMPLSSSNVRSQVSKEGINGSVFIDETHVVDREFMGRISRAGISRSEPLHVEVSTAGDNPDSYGKERYDYGKLVESGKIEDHQTFFMCHEVPQDLTDADLADDPIKYGKLANPAWGHTIGEEEYLGDYNESKVSISSLAQFKMYRLNIWQRSTNPWLRVGDWQKCKRDFAEADLVGQACGAGLDLSKTEDMTAFALVFPDAEGGDEEVTQAKLLTYYWLPSATIDKHRHEIDYAQWQRDGWLRVIPGEVIDYSFVEHDINEILGKFDVRCFNFDVYFAKLLVQRLATQHGYDDDWAVEFPQTITKFAGPTAQFERMVLAGNLHHDGNPVTAWQVGHTQVKHDANANMRPVKPPKNDIKKIDGVVAGIMALDAANRMPQPSVYEGRGIIYAGDV